MSATRIIIKLLASFGFAGVRRVTVGLSSVGPPPWFKTIQLFAIWIIVGTHWGLLLLQKFEFWRSFQIRHCQKVCQNKAFFWIISIVSIFAHIHVIFILLLMFYIVSSYLWRSFDIGLLLLDWLYKGSNYYLVCYCWLKFGKVKMRRFIKCSLIKFSLLMKLGISKFCISIV